MSDAEDRLPFLLGLPHGSIRVPPALEARLRVDAATFRAHSDIDTERIYDLPVAALVKAGVHRYVCDPNRAPDSYGPNGVVPLQCFDTSALYADGDEPGAAEIRERIVSYHSPYHDALTEARQDDDLLYHFECHSMEAIPPPRAGDRGRYQQSDRYRRADVCLMNLGDARGGPGPEGFTTCPQEDLVKLQRLFQGQGFRTVLNDPFTDGWSVGRHGRRWYAGLDRVPAIQLELQQEMWLTGPRGDWVPERGADVRARLLRVLRGFVDYLTEANLVL